MKNLDEPLTAAQPISLVDALLGEHGLIEVHCREVDAACRRPMPVSVVRARAEMLGATLLAHADLEDRLFYAALAERVWLPPSLGPLRECHETLAALLTGIEEASDAAAAVALLRTLLDETREHLRCEERTAFPLATSLLSAAELTDLGHRWAVERQLSSGPPPRRGP